MMKFSYQFDEKSPTITMELSPESTLSEVFEAFGAFLQGAGYTVDGPITIEGATNETNNAA
jgi:hypothetical protein